MPDYQLPSTAVHPQLQAGATTATPSPASPYCPCSTAGRINHSYPFCWRSDTPLVQLACPAWFVSVEPLKSKLLANNKVSTLYENVQDVISWSASVKVVCEVDPLKDKPLANNKSQDPCCIKMPAVL